MAKIWRISRLVAEWAQCDEDKEDCWSLVEVYTLLSAILAGKMLACYQCGDHQPPTLDSWIILRPKFSHRRPILRGQQPVFGPPVAHRGGSLGCDILYLLQLETWGWCSSQKTALCMKAHKLFIYFIKSLEKLNHHQTIADGLRDCNLGDALRLICSPYTSLCPLICDWSVLLGSGSKILSLAYRLHIHMQISVYRDYNPHKLLWIPA